MENPGIFTFLGNNVPSYSGEYFLGNNVPFYSGEYFLKSFFPPPLREVIYFLKVLIAQLGKINLFCVKSIEKDEKKIAFWCPIFNFFPSSTIIPSGIIFEKNLKEHWRPSKSIKTWRIQLLHKSPLRPWTVLQASLKQGFPSTESSGLFWT